MGKIKIILGLLVTISFIITFAGIIMAIWIGFLGIKVMLTGLTTVLCSAFFYSAAKEIEKEKPHDN